MLLFTFDPKKNKKVLAGEFYYPSLTFIKEVKSIHYMIRERGYGISEDIIQQLVPLNCQKITILAPKKKIYDFNFEELLNQPIKNYGHGEQRFIKV
jgi:hypothetical protein